MNAKLQKNMAGIDEKRGTRNGVKYRGENCYVNVFPGEVYISSVHHKDPLTAAGLEGFARMTAL